LKNLEKLKNNGNGRDKSKTYVLLTAASVGMGRRCETDSTSVGGLNVASGMNAV